MPPPPPGFPTPPVLAGFWLRVATVSIDWALLAGVFCLIAGPLFYASHGGWQTPSPLLRASFCASLRDIPKDLQPPPPDGSNAAQRCRIYSISGMTASSLVVSRVTHSDGNTSWGKYTSTTTVSTGYPQDAEGNVVDGRDTAWIFYPVLLLYLVVAQRYFGMTAGGRALGCRLVRTDGLQTSGVPLGLLVLRYALAVLPFVPTFIVGQLLAAQDLALSGTSIASFAALCLVDIGWIVWNGILIGRRKPAVFDRWLGLTVLGPPPRRPFRAPPVSPATPPPLPRP